MDGGRAHSFVLFFGPGRLICFGIPFASVMGVELGFAAAGLEPGPPLRLRVVVAGGSVAGLARSSGRGVAAGVLASSAGVAALIDLGRGVEVEEVEEVVEGFDFAVLAADCCCCCACACVCGCG